MAIRHTAPLYLAFLMLGLIFGTNSAMADLAAMPANECDVSLSAVNSICSNVASVAADGAVVVNDSRAPIIGARSLTNAKAATPIDAYGYCRYVNNASANSIFVPFRTLPEWLAFIKNLPVGISLQDCSRGGAVVIPPDYGSSPQTNQCTVASPASQSFTAPYKAFPPAPLTSPAVAFSCQSPTGTAFTETAIAQYTGLDSGATEPNAGVVGWSLSNVLYTYNGLCGSANGVAILTAPTAGLCNVGVASDVELGNNAYGWTCSGGNGGGNAASCGAPLQTAQCGTAIVDINGNLTSGHFCTTGASSAVNTIDATYTCSQGSDATATSASCKAIMPGQCGSDAGQTLASAPVNLCNAGDAASPVTQTADGWTWSCALAGENDTASCSATSAPPVDGSCATVNYDPTPVCTGGYNKYGCNNYTTPAPPGPSCTSGNVVNYNDSSWTCQGQNGGSSVSCAYTEPAASACNDPMLYGPCHGHGDHQ